MQIIADGQHERLDEKKVPYRKRMGSDEGGSLSSISNPSGPSASYVSSKRSYLGKRKFAHVKDVFIAHVDAYAEGDLDRIHFEYDFVKGTSLVTIWSAKKGKQP